MAGFSGIATEKLTEENYENWKECLKSYFIANDLWDVVCGEYKKPKESEGNYKDWVRKNAMALHAIQISCKGDTMSKLRGNESAEYEWNLLANKVKIEPPNGKFEIQEEEKLSRSEYRDLSKAVERGDWQATRTFLERKTNALREKITLNGDTVFHVAVMAEQTEILKNLLENARKEDLEDTNGRWDTQLSPLLPSMDSKICSKEMVRYLYTKDSTNNAESMNIPIGVAPLFSIVSSLMSFMDQLEKIGWDEAIYDAIKNGIVEFVDEVIESTPEIIWRKDKKGRTIFAHAIVQRQEKIFSHVYNLGAKMRIAVIRHDIFRNNFLHLAAKLSPHSQLDRISGAALQMQRELEWFEEVSRILPPKYMEELNENNKTPGELFTEAHAELVNEGERWMKNTAASCMVVATLIAAVMFTSAFTVPGGNDEREGTPIFLNRNAFLIFVISNAFSLFSSSTSVLVFLGILTSRYAEKDFRKSLPTKLIVGLFTLFFSIVTMMACFGAAISLVLEKRLHWVGIPVIVLSLIPIALYASFQFPLLIEIMIYTFGGGIFKKKKATMHEGK
ncbi:hypothetical protein Pint_27200 [Pistacia integerrima]|uniref:Uncharacterized protein n=1 Tax=Pistacia integerrima TaxID=434235 RepID=A0ACC0YNY1_9ROSI|nr:hypothetical protein Pint_27200 [Pistacia integerrima]